MRNRIIKINLITITIITTAMCYLSTFVNADNAIPLQADISVSGISLVNPESTQRILADYPNPKESGDDFPVLHVCNIDKTEVLTLVFHPGDVRGSFSEFRIKNISKLPIDCIKPYNPISNFVTEKGIHLGIPQEKLINILGPNFTKNKKGNIITIRYKIDDFSRSSFLKKYNLPMYYGDYHFIDGKLVKFEFGFEYP